MSSSITDISGIGPAAANALAEHGIHNLKALAKAGVEQVSSVPGFSDVRSRKVIAAAAELLGSSTPEEPAEKSTGKDAKGKKHGKDKKKNKKDKKKKGKKGKGKNKK